MSEDNEYDNEWGTKKQKYYSMNKRENNSAESDSDFIEEEKEAIRLQKLRAQKIKKSKILNEDEEEENLSDNNNDKNIKNKIKEKKEEKEINKDIVFNKVDIDAKKIMENIEGLKYSLEEIQNTEDEIKIFEENKSIGDKLPKTLEYLKEYKKFNILNSANILFYIISSLNQNMTGYHPSIKNSAILNYLLTKNSKKNEEIQNNIEKIIINLDKNKNSNEEEEEIEDIEEENDMDEEGEEIDDINGEENEEDNEEEDEEELELNEDLNELKNKKKKNNKIESKTKSKEKEKTSKEKIKKEIIPEKVKKPSFLNKKKKRSNNFESDKGEIDFKKNENFGSNSEDNDDEDSFIKEQYKSFNKLNQEKQKLDLKKKEDEKKEISDKNEFAIRKANKEVLKARGLVRKRKKYQGNAKLMNREKFYKKEKLRKKLVKEYEGKPDVYMGEATGIRKDLIRSTKIH